MPNYSQGKIYTIRCYYDTSLIYVGSTTQPLSKRLGCHKTLSKTNPNTFVYSTINGEWAKWYIELYERFPCKNKEELEKREGEIIRLVSTLNKKIAGRTRAEYYIYNIDKLKEQKKQSYIENADKRKENSIDNADKTKQYRIDNAEKLKQYRIDNADKIKQNGIQYRIDNKEKLQEKSKIYYFENAEKIKENRLKKAEHKQT